MDKALAVAICLMLGGCATVFGGGIPCSAGPIILQEGDRLTDETARQIVALDNAGAKICDWQAPGGA